MLVMLLARLQDTFGEIHPVWVLFKTEQDLTLYQQELHRLNPCVGHFSGCWRAVNERRLQRIKTLEVIAVYVAQKAFERRHPTRL